MHRFIGRAIVAAAILLPASAVLAAPASPHPKNPVAVARQAAPVVLTGAQLPSWSRLPAEGIAQPYPSGANQLGDGKRTAHNGRLVVPPDVRTGVRTDQIAAYRWATNGWQEVPVQVDQRFPYFLANGRSEFSFYSGTDEELTYAWTPDRHAVGEEAWKKVFGDCAARYAVNLGEVQGGLSSGVVGLGPQEKAADYLHAMQDPVPTLDDDDEIAFMERDAGAARAPSGTTPPAHATSGQLVTVVDPLRPGELHYLYLFVKPGGSKFTAANSPYVQMQRDADANEWIDKKTFTDDDPEKVGTSNTGYGFNIPGSVCRTADPAIAPDGTPRPSDDRWPRDGMTVRTPTYQLHASGRWMVRSLQVTRPGTQRAYGPDLISRWKGRAFQQGPDSTISIVGFEDEQVNWEGNSTLLGWRAGPVRAIREIWGADSGTNVTKTETYYRDADVFGYHVRVHPIPPDGLYTSWDYNPGAVSTYYNPAKPNGVPIDGINDDVGNIDQIPVSGDPAYFDTCDPTFDVCSALDRPEEVAGPNGGLVYQFELTGPTGLAGNMAAVPYYRDDRCLDDGTGDAPMPRPWPGEAATDSRVQSAYIARAIAAGAPLVGTEASRAADWQQLMAECHKYAAAASWGRHPVQAATGQHGIHFFVTQDSDNLFGPKPVDEIDGQQWRFSVPMLAAKNVALRYGLNVSAKLVPIVVPLGTG